MEVEIGPEEKHVDLYWIVQRQHIVHENEFKCPTVSKSRCYTSTKRSRRDGNSFAIKLVIDELTRRDMEDPIVLVKDFRDPHGEDLMELYFVPTKLDTR